ncbi:MAG TPA: bifunctional diaminohydroxyphosphoribosylaminopyrimidine deaminase/5-amino-6-(5-phosphoribosylamino)uracil reductase RibD [Intrasporangium sp.]|uniref:bifunctional diaminohydroxyphosphoribosylaminopyrimidine deaminase/5-amino-6-(5-phosphoribosylamino)uracil reductase RibD n=1 Tax=Intrasporangium sp. TaxID=1925024 RepID=UPI002B487F4E|nr:bifunctional diaminohydroxyphosphoribosylaminopyrimidine deaminase/5-amino-6-(5-phosphoribosylamino)uracil reductase RibD [Intrasporangium sp.]HKX67523.1 bifunctional diaminohydroxyphosphoribosylaminopyrimidine deaminase/5-amino-6-(5-phosphoribosylamino)uracil reductase RibD [Intrasporangium sp.]
MAAANAANADAADAADAAVNAMDVAFMRRALDLATRGSWPDPNPRVGCVIVDPAGGLIGEGWHRGAGTPHGEAAALAVAGDRARGGTAYVSLEPCAHTGRTGPCADALVAAGVSRVVYGQDDPNGDAAGGAEVLRAAGVEVVAGVLADEAAALNERWAQTIALGRPLVTWKFAATLDGRSAAADGTSQWITSEEARADVHALRASRDAILAGTGTVLVDDPALTVRTGRGRMPLGTPAGAQPLRVVVGLRDVPASARIHEGPGEVLQIRSRDPHEVLAALWNKGVRDVWLEGGPRLASAFLRAGLVDEVYAYLAPAFLGAGRPAVGDLGITSMEGIRRLALGDVRRVGADLRIHATTAYPVDVPVSGRAGARTSSLVGVGKAG